MSFGGKQVQEVREEQGVQGQLTSSKGPERMGNSLPWKKERLPSKGITFFMFFPKKGRAHL
jgi:hypothetical protein